MFFASLCLNLSLQDGHLGGREPPTHLRQNVCPHDTVTGSDIRNRQIGHSSRSIFGVCNVTAFFSPFFWWSEQRREGLSVAVLHGPCKHAATGKNGCCCFFFKHYLKPSETRAKSALQTKFPFCFKVPYWRYLCLAPTYSQNGDTYCLPRWCNKLP